MQTSLNELEYLVGGQEVVQAARTTPALPVFSSQVVDFLADLSRELLADRRVREYVDVTSYAYWIRKASLLQVKEKHTDRKYRLGRGVAFHVAPSNVPVNFAVSMTSSLLAGNITLIRVSNKPFPQVELICSAINRLLETTHLEMKPYLCLFRYEHNQEITQEFSAICDVRIIWGGNQTIKTIRQAPIPPRAIEMAFADRHSLAVIQAEAYLQADEKEVAKGFYTDTYYTDQNACSSPRLVVWLGQKEEVVQAQGRFWESLRQLVEQDYDMKPIQAVDKYSSFCDLAMDKIGVQLLPGDNKLVRVQVEALTEDLMDYKSGGGYFFEYTAGNLEQILPVLTKQCQTISVFGVPKQDVLQLVLDHGVRGVDRIVPLGQTMGLEFIWDGYKMIENMSRFVYVGEYE